MRTRMPGLLVASEAPVRFVPVSETLTDVPALPVFGVKAVMVGAPTPPVLRVMESRFPTAPEVRIRRDIAMPVDDLGETA